MPGGSGGGGGGGGGGMVGEDGGGVNNMRKKEFCEALRDGLMMGDKVRPHRERESR